MDFQQTRLGAAARTTRLVIISGCYGKLGNPDVEKHILVPNNWDLSG